MPLVRQMVAEIFGCAEFEETRGGIRLGAEYHRPAGPLLNTSQNPDEAVALGAAIYEPRIARVAMISTFVSFKSDVPYVNQRMGVIAPRILRDTGDVPHLAALVAPRRLLISGGVTGDGEAQVADALRDQFAYTQQIYRLHGVEAHLMVTAAEKPEDLVRRLL